MGFKLFHVFFVFGVAVFSKLALRLLRPLDPRPLRVARTFGHTEQSAYPNVPTMIRVLAGKATSSVVN